MAQPEGKNKIKEFLTGKIISRLNRHRARIIRVLSTNEWDHFKRYFSIKGNFRRKDFSGEFKRRFCAFYIMNGPRGLNNPQKKEFFKLLRAKESNLGKILRVLYKISGYGKKHKLFLSFGTKLLHTVNEALPIYDKNIAHVLELPVPTFLTSLTERIENRVSIYRELNYKFKVLLRNPRIKKYLVNMEKELKERSGLPEFHKRRGISRTKLLDSSLWALYTVMKKPFSDRVAKSKKWL